MQSNENKSGFVADLAIVALAANQHTAERAKNLLFPHGNFSAAVAVKHNDLADSNPMGFRHMSTWRG